jgi:hypothetical protein
LRRPAPSRRISLRRFFRVASLLLTVIFFTLATHETVRSAMPSYYFEATLPMPPTKQDAKKWCWLASVQMVLQYLNVPNIGPPTTPSNSPNVSSAQDFQCAIIGALAGPGTGPDHQCYYDCTACKFSAATVRNVKNALDRYPLALRALRPTEYSGQEEISSVQLDRKLSRDEIQHEIDLGRPIIMGINTSGLSSFIAEHAVVLVGYKLMANGTMSIVVNDPYPYDSDRNIGPTQNPWYEFKEGAPQPLRYVVNLEQFEQAMPWTSTIYRIHTPTQPGVQPLSKKPFGDMVVPHAGAKRDPEWAARLAQLYNAFDTGHLESLAGELEEVRNEYNIYKPSFVFPDARGCYFTSGKSWRFHCQFGEYTKDITTATRYYEATRDKLALSVPSGESVVNDDPKYFTNKIAGAHTRQLELTLYKSNDGTYVVSFEFRSDHDD